MKYSGFERDVDTRSYLKRVIISSEGDKTEPAYFNSIFNGNIVIKCLHHKTNSAPEDIYERAFNRVNNKNNKKPDSVLACC